MSLFFTIKGKPPMFIKLLNKKDKNENIHLINSWFKYGYDSFDYEIIEKFDNIDEKYISELSAFFIICIILNIIIVNRKIT